MHNIFQPLSSVALLQQCRQHYLKEKQLKWKLADWDLATKTNKTNLCTTECTCKSTSFRWVKGGEGRGRAPKKMLSTLRQTFHPPEGFWSYQIGVLTHLQHQDGFGGKHAGETCQISDHKQGLCKSDQHQFSPDSSNAYLRKKRLWELITRAPKGKCFDLLSNSLN